MSANINAAQPQLTNGNTLIGLEAVSSGSSSNPNDYLEPLWNWKWSSPDGYWSDGTFYPFQLQPTVLPIIPSHFQYHYEESKPMAVVEPYGIYEVIVFDRKTRECINGTHPLLIEAENSEQARLSGFAVAVSTGLAKAGDVKRFQIVSRFFGPLDRPEKDPAE